MFENTCSSSSSALKGAARECRRRLILAWCWEKVKGLDPGWPLAGQTFKICVRAGVRLCSALCSKMSAVLEGQRCWSICEYLGPESKSKVQSVFEVLVTELCSTCSVFEVCSCVRTCVRTCVRVDSLVKGTCVRAFEGTRSRNTEILCSSVFRLREQIIYMAGSINRATIKCLKISRRGPNV